MKRLSIHVTEMSGRIEIETLASGSVTTQLVCRNCPVTVLESLILGPEIVQETTEKIRMIREKMRASQ
ncbi:hypothetical protein A2U01_0090876, partial [Trifolium medium]|nr:hypothetical protein [Trifolium medium]